ncbi:hypothetical protein CONPUDRAFT_71471 [Coniophora puteana RWD-64-598 SS2]|uniref:Uncharacterized protein n=1 Tax=Coniophora puteana (strain RWD-64-598) TaxID=741705 RepID=A0A5M3MUA5_CONPW|nr:uncharacterized protein CONPUDRAFT_71471 [Coniophora puteana RWD-64-598 SS2]EIW82748.1 hypothetical protein CONPUDRAFT_71471 [Coniophora puteana RWD-64-598 SS2]
MGDNNHAPPPLPIAYLGAQTGVYALGIALTVLRMWIRRGRYWVEDVLALLGTLFSHLCLALTLGPGGADWTAQADRIFFWLDLMVFVMEVWSTRASILVSVLRVTTNACFRKLILASLALFVVFWAVSFGGKMWLCTDAISAIILVGLPLAMLWNVQLACLPRILILSIFATGVLNAACALDLIACNLLVTVTFLFRVLLSDKSSYYDDTTTPPKPILTERVGGSAFTTVDLDSVHFVETQEDYGRSQSTIAWNDAAWGGLSDYISLRKHAVRLNQSWKPDKLLTYLFKRRRSAQKLNSSRNVPLVYYARLALVLQQRELLERHSPLTHSSSLQMFSSRSASVWTSLMFYAFVRSSRLPRLPGPLTTQTQQMLECILAQATRVRHNILVRKTPVQSYAFPQSPMVTSVLLAGRWVFSQSLDLYMVMCRDIKASDAKPAVILKAASGRIGAMRGVDVIDREGRRHVFLVLERSSVRTAGDLQGSQRWDLRLLILKLNYEDDSKIHLEPVYQRQHTFVGLHPRHSVEVIWGPSAFLIDWSVTSRDHRKFVVYLAQEGLIQEMGDNDLGVKNLELTQQLYIITSTHILTTGRFVMNQQPTSAIAAHIYAVPISSVLNNSVSIASRGVLDVFTNQIQAIVMLRDSVISPVTGVTDVVLLAVIREGQATPTHHLRSLVVFRLVIPPASPEESSRPSMIEIHKQILSQFTLARNDSYMIQPSSLGSTTFLSENDMNGNIKVLEIIFDEEEQKAWVTCSSGLNLRNCVKDENARDFRLECGKNEPEFGRLSFSYGVSGDGRSQGYRPHNLGHVSRDDAKQSDDN